RELRYSTRLTGGERFVREHVVQGRGVVPAVVQLEWARAAVSLLLEGHAGNVGLHLTEVTSVQPLVVNKESEIHIALEPLDDGGISYEIYSEEDGQTRVYCRGYADPDNGETALTPAADALRMPDGQEMTAEAFYERLAHAGWPQTPGVRRVLIGDDSLVVTLEAEREVYDWSPALIDGVLQATCLLGAKIPPQVSEIRGWRRSSPVVTAKIRRSGSAEQPAWQIVIYDDEQRPVLMLAAGPALEAPELPAQAGMMTPAPDNDAGLVGDLTLFPDWVVAGEAPAADGDWPSPSVLKIECEHDATPEALRAQLTGFASCAHLLWQVSPIAGTPSSVVGLRLVQALLAQGYGRQPLRLTVLTTQGQAIAQDEIVDPDQAAVHGLIGALAKEYPLWRIRLLDLPAGQALESTGWQSRPADVQGNALLWRDSRWHRACLRVCRPFDVASPAFRQGGVYVILGGAGGIGCAFSEYLIRQYQAQIVWLGRRAEDADIGERLDKLGGLGPRPRYIQADAADRDALELARETITDWFGPVHGVVHSAIVLADGPLEKMDEARFSQALNAKTLTADNLVAVFGELPLDFMLFFSAMQSFSKAAAQANYASGCCYADAVAHNQYARPYPVKVMHWGYWGSVGVVAQASYRSHMALLGLGSVEAPQAMAALEKLLAGPLRQVGFIRVTDALVARSLTEPDGVTVAVAPVAPEITLPALAPMTRPGGTAPVRVMEQHLSDLLLALLAQMSWLDDDASVPQGWRRWRDAGLYLLQRNGKDLSAPPPGWQEAWAQWQDFCGTAAGQPGVDAQLRLINATLNALPAILSGEQAATAVIFPEGGLELVDGVYRDHPLVVLFNELLAGRLEQYVRARVAQQPDCRLRILEIGAGTGGTSISVFKRLTGCTANIEEYTYTDISPVFLSHAQTAFRELAPYLRTQRLDIEKAVTAQGVEAGSYDIVVATNVLHATRDIRHTLRHAKSLLKRNGLLLINEMADASVYTHLTFGLLDGWWLADDPWLRLKGAPGLATESWLRVLADSGFCSAQQLAPELDGLGQQVLQAVSDGVFLCERENPVPADPVARPVSAGRITEEVERLLRDRIVSHLKLAPTALERDTPLTELGFDSITLVSFLKDFNERYDLELSPTVFFEAPTLAQLAVYLAREHGHRLTETREAPADEACRAVQNKPVRQRRRTGRSAPAPRNNTAEPIAVIGISGTFPGSPDVDALWENLNAGRSGIGDFPFSRWGKPTAPGGLPCGVVDAVEYFDPLFFGISPREALSMDPQQRLLMQYVYKTLEDAGYSVQSLSGSNTALLVGTAATGYGQLLSSAGEPVAGYSAAGMSNCMGPNRMSYWLNWHGPSEPIDTACSSSLVAVHRAIGLLRGGHCDQAVVGGVNTLLSLDAMESFTQAGMVSPSGRCNTFSAQADGYVRSEGVGMLMLKPLSAAERDGDHIYGLLLGSAENHGGRAASLTAPNPGAQSQLIEAAFRDAGVAPESVNYIETHGTGTPLGDPIEIQGLKLAFSALSGDRALPEGHCALGAVKSNIGHLELAAGVAGMIKVLLQMKHRQLVASLNSQPLNPHISLAGSPFGVVSENRPWQPCRDAQGNALPLRAGVSAFGFGGVNAHVLMQEYQPPQRLATPETKPVVIVLSARNEERLRVRISQLCDDLQQRAVNLTDLAYTLQVGREAMSARLAMVVSDVPQLLAKLRAVSTGDAEAGTLFRGNVKKSAGGLALFSQDDDLQHTLGVWIAKGKLDRLADLWVQGVDVDWRRLYDGITPQRISLPTYPFARERYWASAATGNGGGQEARLHPLVHRNTSDFDGQRYSTRLTGEEWFLRDHVVQERAIVPGVVQLEWARAAVALALGADAADHRVVLENVAWIRPLVVERALDVHIALDLGDDGRVGYQIYSDDEDEQIYSQGEAFTASAGDAPCIGLEAMRAGCRRVLAKDEIYPAFEQLGVRYGAGFRVLQDVCLAQDLAIGELYLPAVAQGETVWPAGLLDGALQTSGALGREQALALPFALQRIESWGPLPDRAWAVVQPGEGDGDAVRRLDIVITDEQGRVALRLTGFTSRVVQAVAAPEIVLASPRWVAGPLPAGAARSDGGEHWLMLCDAGAAPDIGAYFPDGRCVRLSPAAPLSQRYTEHAGRLLQLLRQHLENAPGEPCCVQVVTSCAGEEAVMQGLGALLRSACMEYPHLNGQIVVMDDLAALSAEQLYLRLQAEAASAAPAACYQHGQRLLPTWEALENKDAGAAAPWHEDGVYWVIGGLGGLGRAMALAIAGAVKPVLILSGRRTADAEQDAFAARLRDLGATVEFRAVDVSDEDAMRDAVAEILARHGRLNGVIHCAGVLRDRLLANMSDDEMNDVLAPKVYGAAQLDAATRDVALDWMVLCSSIAGAWGNIGQGGYAAGNGYLDHFARYRQSLVERGERRGKTVSIGWPVWAGSGMQTDEARQRHMYRQAGMIAMPEAAGVAALAQALMLPQPYLIALYGERPRLLAWLQNGEASIRQWRHQRVEAVAAVPSAQDDELPAQVERVMMELVAAHLHLPPEVLDRDTPLAEFGFDSITLTSFGSLLNERYGLVLSPTVFFETPTLGALAEYLAREHRDALAAAFSSPASPVPAAAASGAAPSVRRRRRPPVIRAVTADAEPIAVIGMSGCFPQSPDIPALWQNLVAGRDCITELPPDRWEGGVRPAINHAGVIESIGAFDPLFFGISPSEARLMDPQQRLLMLYVHKAIEDAGYSVQSLAGSNTALLVGTMTGGYAKMLAQAGVVISGHSGTGLAGSMGPNRMSYWLDWHGPSEPIETACSSSLVAIHKAVGLLRSGECELAVAGGVNTLLSGDLLETLTLAGMLSQGGRCRTFSAQADGYVRGEGVGMLLLKPLSAAERDGDHIYGVIRGTAQNHGGRATSLTAPNPQAQARLIEKAMRQAGIAPESVGYIEAHGTGTALGDPVEIDALKQAFGNLASDRALPIAGCGLGTIKSNIGHLELAAGVAGVIKVLLQLRHRQLVPSINSEPRNPHITLEGQPFYVVDQGRPWAAAVDNAGKTLPRRAGVSSFGFGGVNAHVVLEEYQAAPATKPSASGPVIVVLSARSKAQLDACIVNLHGHLCAHDVNLTDLAWTLQAGRDAMPVRIALVADSQQTLIERLARLINGDVVPEQVWRGEVKGNQPVLSIFNSDEDLHRAIATWIDKGKLAKLAELWVQGLPVDWRSIYGEVTPRRLSLPTYPFALQRYWLTDDVVSAAEHDAPRSAPPQPVCFSEEWTLQPVAAGDAGSAVKRVVCLLGDAAQEAAVQTYFSDAAPQAVVCCVSDGDLADGLRAAAGEARHIDVLLDLRSATAADEDAVPVLHLLRALHDEQIVCQCLLWAGGCTDDAGQAVLEARIGLVRSLKFSFPAMAAVTISERAAQPTAFSGWLARLWAEVSAGTYEDVLYLDGVRHVCSLVSLPLPVRDATVFRRGDTCWITGGNGGLGARIARYLAQQHGVNLVLSGRRESDDETRALLAELEACGVRACYMQADVTDAEAMGEAYCQAKTLFDRIDGVVHAAGVADQADILTVSDAQFRQVLAAKVTGTRVLDALFSEQPPRFMCYLSSVSAAIGDFGGGAYAMANRFMLAHARLRGNGALAIGWPLWRDGAMGSGRSDDMAHYLSASGQRALESDEGLHLLEGFLGVNDGRQPLVMAGDAARMERLLRQAQTRRVIAVGAEDDAHPVIPGQGYRPEMKGLTLSQCILWDLSDHMQRLLDLPRDMLEADANLAEYGVDSVRLIEITRLLNAHYGLSLTPSVFFSHGTLEQLAAYLEQAFGARMAAFYQQSGTVAEPPAGSRVQPLPVTADSVLPEPVPVPVSGPQAPIAIIGLSGRFPDARDADAFWQLLAQERCVIGPYPEERAGAAGGSSVGQMAALPGIDEFDPLFFNIAPREAEVMDPRQRLLLQEAWKALEDAGYGSLQLSRHKIGMFVGAEQGDYIRQNGGIPEAAALTANHDAMLAARLAYVLDLHGPAMTLNTACSSGLVALHQACRSLAAGDCDTAIVAGVNLMTTPLALEVMARSGMLSSDGTCYAFDRRANGMVAGEACVSLVIKPLAQAQADGDPVYATIVGSGINFDGKTQGITAPSGAAQAALLDDIYRRSGINPDALDYIVTHGTGTPLGDPVEINALCDAFRPYNPRKQYCALTSVKPNVGHALAASGLVSLVALVQALRHETIPASLNCSQESDYIDWPESPFYVNKAARSWPAEAARARLGAVSAFGMSGTNAHVVIQGAEGCAVPPPAGELPPYHLLVVSAKTAEALHQRLTQLEAALSVGQWDAQGLRAMSHTLLNGRQHFAHRCALVIQDAEDARYVLQQALQGGKRSNLFHGRVARDFTAQKALHTYGETLITHLAGQQAPAVMQETLLALADMYCQGYALSWPVMFGPRPPQRLHLPTYPFTRDRYWLPDAQAQTQSAPPAGGSGLHPLVQRNTSDFSRQRYSTTLTGREWFLRDHVVQGQPIVPGVVQ
ncbi:SDR family NAD(P)-dependent oxidoreductase, partial [Enterobacillus tribolii]|uniref:SDR family NAD(P)-dependent oxidoreductase n=1 Tax=Enterobacillus tribolii TaxID=1487935 RepID=UPI000E1D3995